MSLFDLTREFSGPLTPSGTYYAHHIGWWAGYGEMPLTEVELYMVREGEPWPRPELIDDYDRTKSELYRVARKAALAAGNNTRDPQWYRGFAGYSEVGVALWRKYRWLAERINWAC